MFLLDNRKGQETKLSRQKCPRIHKYIKASIFNLHISVVKSNPRSYAPLCRHLVGEPGHILYMFYLPSS